MEDPDPGPSESLRKEGGAWSSGTSFSIATAIEIGIVFLEAGWREKGFRGLIVAKEEIEIEGLRGNDTGLDEDEEEEEDDEVSVRERGDESTAFAIDEDGAFNRAW